MHLIVNVTTITVSDSSPFLTAKQSSSDSIPSYNVYFAASAENRCGRDAYSDVGDGGYIRDSA